MAFGGMDAPGSDHLQAVNEESVFVTILTILLTLDELRVERQQSLLIVRKSTFSWPV